MIFVKTTLSIVYRVLFEVAPVTRAGGLGAILGCQDCRYLGANSRGFETITTSFYEGWSQDIGDQLVPL